MRRFILLLVVIGIATTAWYRLGLLPVDLDDSSERLVTINQGNSLSTIAEKLQNNGLIRSKNVFILRARIDGLSSQLQAGSFLLRKSQSLREILETLHRGIATESRVTIPEGLTIAEIDALKIGRAHV